VSRGSAGREDDGRQGRPGAEPVGDEGIARGGLGLRLLGVGVVVVVVAALAVPRAFGTGGGAGDSSTQSNLMNAVASARTVFVDSGEQYNSEALLVSELAQGEPELAVTFSQVTSQPANSVDVIMSPDERVLLAVGRSPDGRCWDIEDNEEPTPNAPVPADWTPEPGVSYGATLVSAGPQASCGAQFPDLLPGTFTGWSRSWPS